jgi:hypothetical protein
MGGASMYVDMTEGSYLVATTFLTHIKATLESVSADTFTVTYTALNKITIATSGAYFDLLCSDVQFTAVDLLGFDDSADLTGALTYTSDFPRIHSSEWIMVDFGIPVNPESFIAIGKRNEVLNISESATIKLQGNTTDSWDAPEYEATIDWNENVLQLTDITGLHTEALRYWRFYVEDRENADGFLEFSNFFFGDSFVSVRGAAQFGLSNKIRDFSVTVYSDSGVSLSDVKPQTQELNFSFDFMTKEDADNLMYIFEIYGTSKPFFIILDPDGNISVNPQDLTKYVKFTQEPDFRVIAPNVFNVSVSLREEL